MPVSVEDKLKAVETYITSFSKPDVEAIVGLYADNATIEDPVGTPLKEGIDAVREFYTGAVANGAQLEATGTPRCTGDFVAFRSRPIINMNGTAIPYRNYRHLPVQRGRQSHRDESLLGSGKPESRLMNDDAMPSTIPHVAEDAARKWGDAPALAGKW